MINYILGNFHPKLVDLIRIFKKEAERSRKYVYEASVKSGRKPEEEGKTPK